MRAVHALLFALTLTCSELIYNPRYNLFHISSPCYCQMKGRRKSNLASAVHKMSDSHTTRRRNAPHLASSNGIPPGTKEINAGPMLRHAELGINPRGRMTVSRAIATAGIMIQSALPAAVSWGMTLGLIFGGCCSNVSAPKQYRYWIIP